MKYLLIGVLCTTMCKAIFPYPPGDFSKPEVNSTQVDDIHDYSLVSYIEAEKYFTFLHFPIWENEETDDEDETSAEEYRKENLYLRFAAAKISNSSALDLRIFVIPLFILFHSWKHFLF